MNIMKNLSQTGIHSRDNLTLCAANYVETCWCKLNSSERIFCPYLLRYVKSVSNASYFCVYHTLRKTIDCFNSSFIFPKSDSISSVYLHLTTFLFIIGLIGNGLSILILLNKTLRRLSVYRNLAILCVLNIFYLLAILIRHRNTYDQDLRDISANLCRLHAFIVAFTGHLCSWQLVSTSIQRAHALLRLRAHRQTSWIQTWSIFVICIGLPFLLFDGQLLFNYGLFSKRHVCDQGLMFESRQFQRALHFPIENSNFSKNTSIQYHMHFPQIRSNQPGKCVVCILWNILDTFLYAIIPFLIILISSIIIIIKVCERHRSTITCGGVCHTQRSTFAKQDNLSVLLIMINCLFLIMTGPLNIALIIQSIVKRLFSKSFSMKIFLHITQHLRLLQNSYHALSFILYCVAGKKFRKSAYSICRIVYRKLLQMIFQKHRKETAMLAHRFERETPANHRLTVPTSTNDNSRRITGNLSRKATCIMTISTDQRRKILNTYL